MYFKLFTRALFLHPSSHITLLACHAPGKAAVQSTLFTPRGMLAGGTEKGAVKVLRTQKGVTLEPKTFDQAFLKQKLVYTCSYSISRVPGWERDCLWNNSTLPGSCSVSQDPICVGSCLQGKIFSPKVPHTQHRDCTW